VISPIGAILAWALFMDAIQSERMANEILLDSIADRRVSSPSVERLQTEAASLASRTQPELMSTLAMTRAITDQRLRRARPVADLLRDAFRAELGHTHRTPATRNSGRSDFERISSPCAQRKHDGARDGRPAPTSIRADSVLNCVRAITSWRGLA
jgi:hypothetical protein